MAVYDEDEEVLVLASETKDDEEYEELLQKKKIKKKSKEKEPKSVWKEVLDYVKVIAIGALVAFLLCKFVIINAVVPTISMVPTINAKERLIGLRVPYYFNDPKRGDIVIFKAPESTGESGKLYIKRVIGLPGETIQIIGGQAYKVDENGEQILIDSLDWISNKEKLRTDGNRNNQTIVLGKDEYFMMGDNRNHSFDSRDWGVVKRKAILAKAWLKYYKGFKIY